MGVPRIDTGPMTVEEFYAFTDTRPDEEKWELIDGEPVLNAAPSPLHQRIIKNLLLSLARFEGKSETRWEVLPPLGVRISRTSRPEPDLVILPWTSESLDPKARDRSDVLVAFEILSPSTADRDLRWKRKAYTGMPSLTHYVVVAQDTAEVVVFAREAGFAERRLHAGDALELAALGVSVPLAEIYKDTGLV